ncbi:hypothetical protein KVT40_006375 [Elsinoe batatas]|uniref:Uncharacterized protein n=1 Tax=Elsinoe batatas TaxID=2601811 RepID=A0A8K0L042_9PEZI|nr:hypothetical protein KVT40_006375 [Elsinoe batatas]
MVFVDGPKIINKFRPHIPAVLHLAAQLFNLFAWTISKVHVAVDEEADLWTGILTLRRGLVGKSSVPAPVVLMPPDFSRLSQSTWLSDCTAVSSHMKSILYTCENGSGTSLSDAMKLLSKPNPSCTWPCIVVGSNSSCIPL